MQTEIKIKKTRPAEKTEVAITVPRDFKKPKRNAFTNTLPDLCTYFSLNYGNRLKWGRRVMH